MNTNCYSNRQ